MRGITRDTWAELKARKILYAFGALTLFALGFVLLSNWLSDNVNMVQEGASMDPMFGEELNRPLLKGFSQYMAFMLLLAVVASAGLIPRMMEKGRAEFFLSKPIERSRLLISKLFGVWLVYGLSVLACSAIIYLVMGWLFGGLSFGVLYLFAGYLISFAIWLSVTGLIGTLSGSGTMAMMVAFGVWTGQFLLLEFGSKLQALLDSKTMTFILDGLYYLLPKNSELIWTFEELALGGPVRDWMPIWSSLLFAAVLVYLTVWIYGRKDY